MGTPIENEHDCGLALALTTGIGWRALSNLLSAFGSCVGIFGASHTALMSVAGVGKVLSGRIQHTNFFTLKKAQATWSQTGIHYALWNDPLYPTMFRSLHYRPLVVFWRGQREVLDTPAISIVGTREATADALQATDHWSAALARRGWTIVSGLARGIDTQAHRAALDAGGMSVAVLGNGVNVVYPPENRGLAHRLVNQGVVISEFHPDMHVAPNNLIFRNRLITGLSRATVVIECGLESGAMSAARRAYMQGRPVFVRGGSAGTELLLTEGAKLLPERVEDLDQELRSMPLIGQ